MTAMDELHEAKAELRAALLRGVKGTLADERADELINRYQTALKAAHREKVLREAAGRQRAEMRAPGRSHDASCWTRCVGMTADLIDPDVTE